MGSLTSDCSRQHAVPPTLQWVGGIPGVLRVLDQTLLPGVCRYVDCVRVDDVWEAIRALRVRGAPAIGVAAAYGVVIGVQHLAGASNDEFNAVLDETCNRLSTSRPTAVNLFWAIERMRQCVRNGTASDSSSRLRTLLLEAQQIEAEDREMCAAIGRHGAELLAGVSGVLTHCNAGSLATAGDGTALAVIFAAAVQNPVLHVYADETRPLLQGARLTMWELMQRSIDCTLICDSAAGWVMREGRVQAVVTGADRIAANGDAANKIGTYGVSVLARAHGIPFYVAAPSSTFDLSLAAGSEIPIEERASSEITNGFGRETAPAGARGYNPAFDVTPAENIAAIVTERGVIRPVNAHTVREVLAR